MLISLDKFQQYKEDKKVKKLINKHNKKIEKDIVSMQTKKLEMIQKSKDHADMLYEKKLTSLIKKRKKYLERDVRLVIWKKPIKVTKKKKTIKSKAFNMFQLYCRLLRADSEWYVIILDKMERVHYTECNWWHYFGKWTWPHLWFEIDNCWPISEDMNRKQGSLEWLHWKDWLIWTIWKDRFNRLEEMSKNKELKNITRDHDYYLWKYNHFSKLVMIEQKRILKHKK